MRHGEDAGVRRGEAVLVGLAAQQQPVLAHPVADRLPDRVDEQDEADGVAVERRVAAGLVVPLAGAEPISEPRGSRGPAELHPPQPQPALLESPRGEVSMERLARALEPARAAPTRA